MIDLEITEGVSAARGAQVDYDTLFKAADEALYEAKRAGRNRVVGAPAPEQGVDLEEQLEQPGLTLAPQLVG